MYKKSSLIFLGIASLLSSRAIFTLIDDPEGPNLLIVSVLGAIIFFLILGLYQYRVSRIFLFALILNIIWENLHALLYSSYKGGQITEFILLWASLFDALLITLMIFPFLYVHKLRSKVWLIIPLGIILAVVNEWYGLGTGRWVYNSLMPVIPVLNVGLTPTLQLAVTGYLAYKFVINERS